ncbi:MAG: helix-turn-helix domain-containing protein [Clostridia bacterium]|nr:helix-turn-helix domain-containing protein [Clostridia bacterium]
MSDYQDFKKKALENPAVRAEYDRLAAEYAIKQAVIDARQASGLTQQQLAARTGINQADISKLENGSANPSLRTLQRLAAGMGMNLRIEFVPAGK